MAIDKTINDALSYTGIFSALSELDEIRAILYVSPYLMSEADGISECLTDKLAKIIVHVDYNLEMTEWYILSNKGKVFSTGTK